MLENDFIAQNFELNKIGHGLYMINSKGTSFSNSSNKFNLTSISFNFD